MISKTTVVNYKITKDYDMCIMRGTKWGNPFKIGINGTLEEVIEKHKKWFVQQTDLMSSLHEVRGKILGCCCKPYPCHGDFIAEIADKPFRVIIAGTRTFIGYDLLRDTLDKLLINKTNIVIISGTASGADRMGEIYAEERNYDLEYHPANWEQYGQSAGYIRNEEMAKIADACVCFWDGSSKGTKHMIDIAKRYSLQVRVIKY